MLLWGAGDVARLLVDIGHDIRAERIMLARLAHRLKVGDASDRPPDDEPVERDLIERAPAENG